MSFSPIPQREKDYLNRLKWSLLFRLIIVSVIFISLVGFHLRESKALFIPNLIALYFLVGFSYFFTLLSLLLLQRIPYTHLFGYLQAVWEIIFASALVYLTGLWESFFTFLYVLAIFIASILLFRNGAFFSATFSTILYALMLFGVKFQFIPGVFLPEEIPETQALLQKFFYYLCYFYASAVLSSYLSEQLRRTHQELDQARIGLDRLETLNEAIVHSINSGLLIFSPEDKLVFYNSIAEKILGNSGEQMLGKSLKEIFSRSEPELNPSPEEEKIRYTNFQGRELILEISSHPLRTPAGKKLGKLVVLNDITERQEMEEKLKRADRLAVVGRLAAGIAHEIRNPLAAISGSIQLLKQEFAEQSSEARLMQVVLSETERLNQLITDFLLYARPNPRNIREIKLDQLFSDLARLIEINQPEIELVLEMESDIILYSDARLLEQIFWNLVNNAIDAMQGKGRLVIQAKKLTREDKPGVWFQVTDSGGGIPSQHLARIFEPFFTTKEKGTGLGLSTVWRIVEELGGMVEVETEPGKGSSFQVWLPKQPPSEQKKEEER